MARKSRVVSTSGIYHIMLRGNNKMQIFIDDMDNIKFLEILNNVQCEEFQILAYCLMGNHIHLIVKITIGENDILERKMKSIAVAYAAHFNKKYERCGSLFQGRFKSQPVENEGYYLRLLRYVHKNPIEAGIVIDFDKYQWSSYNDYFSSRKGLCAVNTNFTLKHCPVDWLKNYHYKIDNGVNTFIDIDVKKVKYTDKEATALITKDYGVAPMKLNNINVISRNEIIRQLILEDGIAISQLSRLTGISKGEIRKCSM